MQTSNQLAKEKSPYLLQHADNPVAWFPWGEEAFAKAEQEDKPVFLSIGYSTCHWCHVMAHESFEDDKIAQLLNNWFIAIKVDREERPDIDMVYMAATQAINNGSGGWPMSVFLFPDGTPFWAATYIPPTSQVGQAGFADILTAINKAWQDKREELRLSGENIIKALQNKRQKQKLPVDITEKAFAALYNSFDSQHGGFGSAPKFPQPSVFEFLLRYYKSSSNKQALIMIEKSLQAMAAGGIKDHLGGGFHRYSVDGQWRVPHFEKMLYDQAQLLSVYAQAFQVTQRQEYANTAHDICRYVIRDMQADCGGFFSAEDADSIDPYNPGRKSEGGFYLWTEDEIVKVLGSEQGEIFNHCYGVKKYGNALHDPHDDFTGKNILYRQFSDMEAAENFRIPLQMVQDSVQKAREKLLKQRNNRVRPHLDDKIITSWNGLMIGTLARAGKILRNEDYILAARKSSDFLAKNMFEPENNTLKRIYRDGASDLSGQLEDYAFLINGLLELHEATEDHDLLVWANQLLMTSIDIFIDKKNGGFYDAIKDDKLPLRLKNEYDGAEPTANSMMVVNLIRLGKINNNKECLRLAQETMESFGENINRYPQGLIMMLAGYLEMNKLN